jgi:simple sugar transport system permease protein
MFAFFAIAAGSKGFLTLPGTASWLETAAELGIVAIPVGVLMIGGEFDLSVGSTIGATALIIPLCAGMHHWPLWAAILLALAVGWAIGLINGLVVTRTGLPSFIVTLATLLAVAGATLGLSVLLAGTTTLSLQASGPLKSIFAAKTHSGFGAGILWWIAVALFATWVLTQTRFGNWIYATGGDREEAVLAGVPTRLVKIVLFLASSTGAVLIGVIQTLEFGGGDISQGQSYVYDTIIASVIGGVLLTGGYGSALGISLGAATYGMVSIGIFYTGWDTNWVQLFLGGLLLAAVLANNYFRKLATSR